LKDAKKACAQGAEKIIVKTDVKNAHNSFPRVLTQLRLIELAKERPSLIPLAVAHESILRAPNDIYMRSNNNPTGFVLLCQSLMGGGQGNPLTNELYVINQDPALKQVGLMFPDVEIKAIQDDVTIMGSPDDIFDKVDGQGQIVSKGALSALIDQLKARGLDMAENKFECVGSTVNSCARKPFWLKEPTTFTDGNGVVINTRSIDICNNPIGEPQFVQAFLGGKFRAIRSAIENLLLHSRLRVLTQSFWHFITLISLDLIIGLLRTVLLL
jgi:hypothetical protein